MLCIMGNCTALGADTRTEPGFKGNNQLALSYFPADSYKILFYRLKTVAYTSLQ